MRPVIPLSNHLRFAMHAKQAGEGTHLPATKIRILANEIEANLPGAADRHTEREEFCAIQERLNAVHGQPAETQPAANGINCSFDCGDWQEALSRAARLALRIAGTNSFDHHENMLHHIDPGDLPPQ